MFLARMAHAECREAPPARRKGRARVGQSPQTPRARLKREILRFNDELKRKYFPRRADRDCFLARMASPECGKPRPPGAPVGCFAGVVSARFSRPDGQ